MSLKAYEPCQTIRLSLILHDTSSEFCTTHQEGIASDYTENNNKASSHTEDKKDSAYMKVFISATLLFALASTYALSIPDMTSSSRNSLEKQLYNRHADVILQEPIAKAQERADSHALKVKRGEYQPPHHPKYRPTGTAVPPLQTESWEQLALVKRRMEQESLEEKLVVREAREGTE